MYIQYCLFDLGPAGSVGCVARVPSMAWLSDSQLTN